jgi:bacterioferritin
MPIASVGTVEAALQLSRGLHLTAIEQYQAQSEHFRRWGYKKLAEVADADVEEERGHLKLVTERLEYYDIAPGYEHSAPEWPRHDYEGILDANYALESGAMYAERANIRVARDAGDELTAKIFAKLLKGSEASVSEIEATKKLIEVIGLDNFLANKV